MTATTRADTRKVFHGFQRLLAGGGDIGLICSGNKNHPAANLFQQNCFLFFSKEETLVLQYGVLRILAQWLDRCAIKAATKTVREGFATPRNARAGELLNNPEFFR